MLGDCLQARRRHDYHARKLVASWVTRTLRTLHARAVSPTRITKTVDNVKQSLQAPLTLDDPADRTLQHERDELHKRLARLETEQRDASSAIRIFLEVNARANWEPERKPFEQILSFASSLVSAHREAQTRLQLRAEAEAISTAQAAGLKQNLDERTR